MIHVELHRHSRWSILDGAGDGDVWAKRASEIGMPALALTDHASLAGALEHIAGCQKHGVLPILGVEVYYRDNRLWHDKENAKFYHLTLLAMSFKGWINIQRLTSEAYQSGFYGKPCVDPELLAKYSDDVYCLGGCIGGRLAQHIMTGYEPDVIQFLNVLRGIFKDRFSLEIMCHDFDDQRRLNIDTIRVGYEHGVPLTATGDPHYPYYEWAPTQEVRLMIATKQTNTERKKKEEAGEDIYTMVQEHPTLFLMSAEEKAAAFAAFHPNIDPRTVMGAIEHTGEIVSRFKPFLLDRDIKMPPLTRRILSKIDPVSWQQELAAHQNDEDWWNQVDDVLVVATLRRWAFEGLDALLALYPVDHWFKYSHDSYRERLEYELDTFLQIGIHVSRYMVMAAGEVRWARDNGIIVGPGRGSAAGSLVAYCIGITDIDPISYDLMFERFININRKGMPDIDIDFMPGAKGRDRVKAHTADVYGENNVFDIAAFGTYGPRAAIDAVCRVFDDEISFPDRNKYRSAIELKPTDKADLEECAERFELIDQFRKMYPKLWQHALRIEGHPYSYSKHASGVLVKPSNIEIPIATRGDKENPGARQTVTAWPDTKELLANYGFLKLDFLVIDGLVRQYEVLKALDERDHTPIDLRKLPVRWDPEAVDPRVAELMTKGYTLGIWQFEGKGTIPVLKNVKPTNMHDIAAINALIRPGPREAGMTEQYAKRKHGQEPITYWHESVEPVLKKTYGLMIYQEQMMEIAVQLGDFTRVEADDLRKAMGKKYREGMKAVIAFLDEQGYGTKFKHNAALKVGEEMAIDIWENRCIKFGGYSFNACLSGDTVVCRGGAGRYSESPEITIRELWEAQESKTPWGKKIRSGGVKLTQMDSDGRVRLGSLKRIIDNGVKKVFEIKTWNGRSIKATDNHRFMTPDGYKMVSELSPGDMMIAQGEREPYSDQRRNGRGKGHVAGSSYEGQGFQQGAANPAWLDGRTQAKKDAEEVVRRRAGGVCETCGKTGDGHHDLELAHVRTLEMCDGDFLKFHSPDNIKLLCNHHHKKLDYLKGERKKRWTRGLPTEIDVIASIEYLHLERVYDIEMDSPEHNFIANGFVSHNSHAYAYGLISYHDGLLKVEAPADFYAWLLTSTGQDAFKEKLNGAIREGRKFDMKIKPPDINKSDLGFKVLDKKTILYGLESVTGVGPAGAKAIFEHRPYGSFDEFVNKVPKRLCNKNAKKALIGAGAFDEFGLRALMTEDERADNEDAYIGVKLSVKNLAEKYADVIESTVHTEGEFDAAPDGAFMCIGGEITNVKHTRTKNKNEPMGWVNLQYGLDSYRVTVFPPVWALYNTEFRTGRIVFFEGAKQISDQYGPGFIATNFITLEQLLATRAKQAA